MHAMTNKQRKCTHSGKVGRRLEEMSEEGQMSKEGLGRRSRQGRKPVSGWKRTR